MEVQLLVAEETLLVAEETRRDETRREVRGDEIGEKSPSHTHTHAHTRTYTHTYTQSHTQYKRVRESAGREGRSGLLRGLCGGYLGRAGGTSREEDSRRLGGVESRNLLSHL